jgi:ribokinase
MAHAFSISPGGKGSNASVAAARQGARVALIARIGDDDFGRMGMALWQAEGIDTRHVEQVAGERSGVAQILVYEDGDNSIAVYPGAGTGLGARHAQAAAPLLAGCRVVMASCEVPAEATLEAFRLARAAGALTLLNPAPARPLSDELLALVDVLTPNESELYLLAGAGACRLGRRGRRASCSAAAPAPCWSRWVRPVAASTRRASRRSRWPGRPMAVRDTIGAGDTFTGALAAALARGEPCRGHAVGQCGGGAVGDAARRHRRHPAPCGGGGADRLKRKSRSSPAAWGAIKTVARNAARRNFPPRCRPAPLYRIFTSLFRAVYLRPRACSDNY